MGKDIITIYDAEVSSEKILGNNDGIVFVKEVELIDSSRYPNSNLKEPYFNIAADMPSKNNRELIFKLFDTKTPITQELIQQKGGRLKVKVKNLRATFYYSEKEGKWKPSYKADSLEVLP